MSHLEHIQNPRDDLRNCQDMSPIKDQQVIVEVVVPEEQTTTWYKFRKFMREPFSEFFGTMILVLFGDGSIAQVMLGQGAKGDWQTINWGWAYVVSLSYTSQ